VVEDAPSCVSADQAVVAADKSDCEAVHKGLALAHSRKGPKLFATNFRGGKVEMSDAGWHLLGTFTDSAVDPGFAPVNNDLSGDPLDSQQHS